MTGKKVETITNGHENLDAFKVKMTQYFLQDISEDMFMSLYDEESRETKEDIKLDTEGMFKEVAE